MKPIKNGVTSTLAVALSTALMTLSACAAENVNVPNQKITKVSYDWHSNAKKKTSKTAGLSAKERKELAIKIAKHGRGSYICSPSGFGRMSRCHKR